MPVWPPQNTGIFDMKIPGFGPNGAAYPSSPPVSPAFYLRPVTPYYLDTTAPSLSRSSWTLPTDIEFVPVCAQGAPSALTFVSSQVVSSSGDPSYPPVITQTGPFTFSISISYAGSGYGYWSFNIQVVYQDIDGNLGYGYFSAGVWIANYTPASGETINFHTLPTLSSFLGSGVVGSSILTQTQNFSMPSLPGAGWVFSGGNAYPPPDAGTILSGTASYNLTSFSPGSTAALDYELDDTIFQGKLFGAGVVSFEYILLGSHGAITRNWYYIPPFGIEIDVLGNAWSK